MKDKHIAKKLELGDSIEPLARNPAFIMLKDHQENFNSKLLCRLINSSKSKLVKISNEKMENINRITVQNLNVNQWKNSTSVIK